MIDKIPELIKVAKQAMDKAYAPYSNFPVGAVILTATDKIYAGANVENACYAMGHCAEASAVGTMITEGEREIAMVVLISKAKVPIFPCGGCLQKIAEFTTPDTLVISQNLQGDEKRWRFGDLFPEHFDKDILELDASQ